ncbi:hypothetical protein ABW21_db0206065 [Orbilia brochopaga]|nr:hypothetical protein ABW21_db0206065 [Drechslerella brochopaga]
MATSTTNHTGGNFSTPNPPPPSPEQQRDSKIREYKMLIDSFKDYQAELELPKAYTKSLKQGLKGWKKRVAHWSPGHAYLWGPEGLIAWGLSKRSAKFKGFIMMRVSTVITLTW